MIRITGEEERKLIHFENVLKFNTPDRRLGDKLALSISREQTLDHVCKFYKFFRLHLDSNFSSFPHLIN